MLQASLGFCVCNHSSVFSFIHRTIKSSSLKSLSLLRVQNSKQAATFMKLDVVTAQNVGQINLCFIFILFIDWTDIINYSNYFYLFVLDNTGDFSS
jgi:hypothetical protein